LRRLRKLACAGIHVIECAKGLKTWMAGTSPNMTQSAVLWRSATLSLSPKRAYVLCARLCKEDAMTERARMAYYQVAPDALKAVMGVENYIQHCGLEKSLIELVKMRASQINGCAYCLYMHSSDARKAGETEQRLYLLDAWEESRLYTERERAALAWTDAVTKISENHAPAATYEALKPHFSEKEVVDLTVLIGTINPWNRLAISFRSQHPMPKANAA
jgi:AhpD family alkylhydroperoxidase